MQGRIPTMSQSCFTDSSHRNHLDSVAPCPPPPPSKGPVLGNFFIALQIPGTHIEVFESVVTYECSQCEVAMKAEVVQISIITLLDISVLIPPLAELLDGMSGAYASGTGLTHRPFKPQTHCHNVLEENPAERRNPQALDLITATATPS
ncbi:hypothetical protein NQZ68_008719 [Dissostichus eleginoides]|nr:hypothetical protein NQZ68_008719 [Dissostichus eleginoides]